MEKQYKVTEEKFKTAIKMIQDNGGEICSDYSFLVRGVEGEVDYDGEVLTVQITDKPFLASWSMIEGKLDEFFG